MLIPSLMSRLFVIVTLLMPHLYSTAQARRWEAAHSIAALDTSPNPSAINHFSWVNCNPCPHLENEKFSSTSKTL